MRRFRALGLLLAAVLWAADDKPQARCSVTGSVVNAVTGEPLKAAELTLRSTVSSDLLYTAITNAAGIFSLAGGDAGTYELVVRKRGFVQTGRSIPLAAEQAATAIVIRLTPQGVIAGRVLDGEGEPLPGVSVQAIQSHSTAGIRRYSVSGSATTNDLGEYRIFNLAPGRYYLGGAYRSDAGYAAVYYPGVPEAGRAVPIDVPAGGELRGLNLAIRETHSVKIRGSLQSTAIGLQGLMIVAAPCDEGPLNRATTTVRKSDGVFELRDLTPGCYVLAADSYSGGKRYSARLPVTVAETNIDDVQLPLVPPVQLAGRVRVEGEGPLKRSGVVVNLESRYSKVTASGSPAEDGSLLLNNIVPETYELSVVVPDGYYLKSLKFGESDLLLSRLDLSRGATGRLEVVIGADGGSIEGVVADANAQAVEAARVALIAEDPDSGPPPVKIVVTDAKGAFTMRGIKPGNYKIYASQNLDVAALQDPVYAKQLEPLARRISVHEHGQEVVSLKPMAAGALAVRP